MTKLSKMMLLLLLVGSISSAYANAQYCRRHQRPKHPDGCPDREGDVSGTVCYIDIDWLEVEAKKESDGSGGFKQHDEIPLRPDFDYVDFCSVHKGFTINQIDEVDCDPPYKVIASPADPPPFYHTFPDHSPPTKHKITGFAMQPDGKKKKMCYKLTLLLEDGKTIDPHIVIPPTNLEFLHRHGNHKHHGRKQPAPPQQSTPPK